MSEVIHRFKCDRLVSDENLQEHLGRGSENTSRPLQIYDHSTTTGHITTVDNFSIVGREDQNLTRTISHQYT